MAAREVSAAFPCFGGECAVYVIGAGREGSPEQALETVRRRLLGWHERFSRFSKDSELARLNADRRSEVEVSSLMLRLIQAVTFAASLSGGLVDSTLVDEIERAGYTEDLRTSLPLEQALTRAPERCPARPGGTQRWREIRVDLERCTVRRPPGLKFDSGGLAKGVFADVLAAALSSHESFAVDCAGDLRLGGTGHAARAVNVASPFDGSVLHTFELAGAGVATSGIGRRSWIDAEGRPAHHLLDPSSGRPAFTGIAQVTALAPSALSAEILAKAAILSGPERAERWLPHGGVVVLDGGATRILPARLPS